MKIYHNPRCSKSRATLLLLKEKGIKLEIIEYLKTPPTKEELEDIVEKLGMSAYDIVRVGETVWKEKYANEELTDDEILEAIVAHPILLERPIVVSGRHAVIGRPPENVLKLL